MAWKVAERVVEEGAIITLSNTWWRFVWVLPTNSEKLNAKLIPCWCNRNCCRSRTGFLNRRPWKSIDFVLHSIGMSPDVSQKDTTIWITIYWLHFGYFRPFRFIKCFRVALKMNAINERWIGEVALDLYGCSTYCFWIYNDIADAKAARISLHVALVIFMAANTMYVSIQFRNRLRVTTAGSGVKGMDGLLDFSNVCRLLDATAAIVPIIVWLCLATWPEKVTK